MEGSHWSLKEEYEEQLCAPYDRYNLAVPSEITLKESVDVCKEKLNNSVIPYPENISAFRKYVTWHNDTTGGTCRYVWTPLSDQNSEGVFLNMNDNSSAPFMIWDKKKPNGGKDENYVEIRVRTASLNDVGGNGLRCSTCSLSSSLLLRLDGVCEDSFIGIFRCASISHNHI